MKTLIIAAAVAALAPQLSAQAPTEEAVQLATPTGTLLGTLLLPAGRGPAPVALLIAGSGPTDRNGNTVGMGSNNSLRLLAEGLAAQGIATLRYDKRGIAASAAAGTQEADMRFDHLVDDAAGWIAQLKADRRFSGVTVIGHSEGSLIGMIAAQRAGVSRFVSIAGAGRRAGDILRTQLRPQLPAPMFADADSVLTALERGEQRAGPPALAMLFRPSVQPYLISWLRRDPAVEIAGLSMPVLVVQGTTDIQVAMEDAQRLAAANQRARLVPIEGMNHVLKEVPADRAQQIASYTNPELPVAPRLIQAIAEFIR